MSKAEKRKNTWRVRVYDYTDAEGKKHYKSFAADTKQQAQFLAAQFKTQKEFRTTAKNDASLTVADCIDKYMELKPMLSPTTLAAYEKIKKYAFQDIMTMKVSKIDNIVMQSAINREAMRITVKTGKRISPKTLKNEVGLLLSAIRLMTDRVYKIDRIENQKHIKEYPNPQSVIKALKGTDIELPCLLAIWLTFSMSELRGIKCSDIKDGYITINRVKVEVNGEDVVKDNAKVGTRLRKNEIPPYIMNLIENFPTYKKGANTFLIPWSRDKIYGRWQTICKQNDLGDLSFHDLRHLSATIMSYLGVSQRAAEERGGWAKGSTVLPRVYQETFDKERKEADEKINIYFDEVLKV